MLRYTGSLTICLALFTYPPVGAQELDVMSSGGFSAAYQALGPDFSESTNITLNTAYGASTGGAPDSIPVRLRRGEPADVVILSQTGLERLVEAGLVIADSVVGLAESGIGVAAPIDHPLPDISTVEAFRRTLLEAESIAYSASVSGTYLSTEVFPSLELTETLAPKSTRVISERVGAVVARGDATLGFQQVSELLPIAGIRYVGELPTELQKITVFSAGITTRARQPEAAARLLAHLTSTPSASTIRNTGMRPLSSR